MVRDEILKALEKATGFKDIRLDLQEKEAFGDYSTNIAFGNKKPREFALGLVKKLQEDNSLMDITEKIEVAGGGFINFWIKKNYLLKNLDLFASEKLDFYSNLKIMVEFAHPNTHKLFHIGHLRNITTGEAMLRILERCGAGVIRVNYQGDVGLHIAKALYGVQKLGF